MLMWLFGKNLKGIFFPAFNEIQNDIAVLSNKVFRKVLTDINNNNNQYLLG